MKHLPSMKQLQYLIALADTKHFARAAKRCFVTQSTLSAGIRDLESVLGTAVAERTNRRVLMTPIGLEIAKRAKALLQTAQDVMDVARAGTTPMSGDIHLGVIPTVSPFLLPRILPALGRAFPDLMLYLREEQTVSLLGRLHEGELDAALIALPYDTGGLDTALILEDEFMFACAKKHALAQATTVSVKALSAEALLLLEEGHCLRGHMLDVCAAGNKRIRVQFEASSLHTLVQMVAADLGVTLIPKLAIDAGITKGTGITLLPLSNPASRQLGLVWRQTSLRAEELERLGVKISKLAAT